MDKNKIVNTRKNLYDSLTKNSHIKIINGRHKGKMGQVLRVGRLRNHKYNNNKNKYHNYFDLTVLVNNKRIVTSCRNIKIV
mgnify:CR=1 FL=1